MLHDLHHDLKFFPKRMKMGNIENFVANLHDKKNMSYTHEPSTKSWIGIEKGS